MTEKIIYIADDLTGACDTASFICDYTESAVVILNIYENELKSYLEKIKNKYDCNLVISTNTREIEPETAYLKLKKIGNFLSNIRTEKVFKKIDSAFRGNIASEINALMDSLHINICFVINSIPSMDRITLGGFQIIKGKVLNDTEFNKDPVKIARSSFIPQILSEKSKTETFRNAGYVSLEEVRYGDILEAINKKINRGIRIISFDSATYDDIKKIIGVIYRKFEKALYVGTLGLLGVLNKEIFKESGNIIESNENKINLKKDYLNKQLKSKKSDVKKRFIGFTSSKYEITRKQLSQLKKILKTKVVKIRINDFLEISNTDYASKIKNIANNLVINIEKKGLFVTSEFKGEKEPGNLSKMILKILSDIAFEILSNIEIGRIILIGGETGLNILESLKAKNIEIKGRIIDGVSYGVISDGLLRGKELMLKGGSVGYIDSIVDMVNFEF